MHRLPNANLVSFLGLFKKVQLQSINFKSFATSSHAASLSGGVLVFWEAGQKHIINCEEMKLCKILDLNVKVKTDERKYWPIDES